MSVKNIWWRNSSDPHEHIHELIAGLRADQQPQRLDDLRYAKMYCNRNFTGFGPHEYHRLDKRSRRNDDGLRLNVIANIIDTIVSKLSVNAPRVVVSTTDAPFNIRSKHRPLQYFIDGALEESGAFMQGILAFKDACIVGTGCLKVERDGKKVNVARVPKHELTIDDEAAYYGDLNEIHQTKLLDRQVAISLYPDHKRILEKTSAVKGGAGIRMSDMIAVTESWHLGLGDEMGKHALTVENGTLSVDDWDLPLPFVFVHFKNPLMGFWGQGVVEELRPTQREINKLLMFIQESMSKVSSPMVFLQAGSAISKPYLSGTVGAIVPYDGQPPIIRPHQAIHPEVYQHVWQLESKMYEISGVSKMSASGKKTPGVNAAVAMREMQSIESERFSVVQKSYEEMYKELARVIIALVRDLYASGEDYEVEAEVGSLASRIKWSEIDLEDTDYRLTLDTASRMPLTRAGKQVMFLEWLNLGIIDRSKYFNLVGVPDGDEEIEIQNAAKEYIRECVYRIIYKDEDIDPEPSDDLKFAYKHAIQSLQRARLDEFPDESISRLENYISAIEQLIAKAKQAAAPPPDQVQQQQRVEGAQEQQRAQGARQAIGG